MMKCTNLSTFFAFIASLSCHFLNEDASNLSFANAFTPGGPERLMIKNRMDHDHPRYILSAATFSNDVGMASSNPEPTKKTSSSSSASSSSTSRSSTKTERPRSATMPPPGRWEEMEGNYILRPPPEFGQPRALISFLGGALVGASPHIAYRYILERLSEAGYLIVATPYNLSFDHLATCDAVIGKFERIAPTLARQYGAVPVVGVGHSCGALLQVLITSLFPDTPRAANALLSYNNKPIKEAVPFFDEVFAPLFTAVAAKNETYPSGTEAMALGLELARTVTDGKIPSDELLSDISKFAIPGLFSSALPESVALPTELRDTLQGLVEPTHTALKNAGVMPMLKEGVEVAEQLPLLINEVSCCLKKDYIK
uniref:DUF1350 domain-containing protein n=1 Tax=Ditylum brightwellii TaxID=49249 RepID=A0A7S4VBX0_9STRA